METNRKHKCTFDVIVDLNKLGLLTISKNKQPGGSWKLTMALCSEPSTKDLILIALHRIQILRTLKLFPV